MKNIVHLLLLLLRMTSVARRCTCMRNSVCCLSWWVRQAHRAHEIFMSDSTQFGTTGELWNRGGLNLTLCLDLSDYNVSKFLVFWLCMPTASAIWVELQASGNCSVWPANLKQTWPNRQQCGANVPIPWIVWRAASSPSSAGLDTQICISRPALSPQTLWCALSGNVLCIPSINPCHKYATAFRSWTAFNLLWSILCYNDFCI